VNVTRGYHFGGYVNGEWTSFSQRPCVVTIIVWDAHCTTRLREFVRQSPLLLPLQYNYKTGQ
jgi:hypothetical protein